MNILLIGGGWLAETAYVVFLAEMETIEQIYIADLDLVQTKKRFSQYPKVVAVKDTRTINYEAVCILTPNDLHARYLLQHIDQPIKILVESLSAFQQNKHETLKRLSVNN